jgi:hypothetical protein
MSSPEERFAHVASERGSRIRCMPHVQDEIAPFVCECGSADCIGALLVTVEEYETAHAAPDRFIVKPEHVYPDVEHVIERHDRCWTVEKHPGEMPVH